MTEIPLFLFGGFVTILVAIGVVLAVFELRQAHAPVEPNEAPAVLFQPSKPPSSV